MRIYIVVTILLLFTVPCYGAEYYIDTVLGSNANSGAYGDSWASPSYALAQGAVVDGDTFYIYANNSDSAYIDYMNMDDPEPCVSLVGVSVGNDSPTWATDTGRGDIYISRNASAMPYTVISGMTYTNRNSNDGRIIDCRYYSNDSAETLVFRDNYFYGDTTPHLYPYYGMLKFVPLAARTDISQLFNIVVDNCAFSDIQGRPVFAPSNSWLTTQKLTVVNSTVRNCSTVVSTWGEVNNSSGTFSFTNTILTNCDTFAAIYQAGASALREFNFTNCDTYQLGTKFFFKALNNLGITSVTYDNVIDVDPDFVIDVDNLYSWKCEYLDSGVGTAASDSGAVGVGFRPDIINDTSGSRRWYANFSRGLNSTDYPWGKTPDYPHATPSYTAFQIPEPGGVDFSADTIYIYAFDAADVPGDTPFYGDYVYLERKTAHVVGVDVNGESATFSGFNTTGARIQYFPAPADGPLVVEGIKFSNITTPLTYLGQIYSYFQNTNQTYIVRNCIFDSIAYPGGDPNMTGVINTPSSGAGATNYFEVQNCVFNSIINAACVKKNNDDGDDIYLSVRNTTFRSDSLAFAFYQRTPAANDTAVKIYDSIIDADTFVYYYLNDGNAADNIEFYNCDTYGIIDFYATTGQAAPTPYIYQENNIAVDPKFLYPHGQEIAWKCDYSDSTVGTASTTGGEIGIGGSFMSGYDQMPANAFYVDAANGSNSNSGGYGDTWATPSYGISQGIGGSNAVHDTMFIYAYEIPGDTGTYRDIVDPSVSQGCIDFVGVSVGSDSPTFEMQGTANASMQLRRNFVVDGFRFYRCSPSSTGGRALIAYPRGDSEFIIRNSVFDQGTKEGAGQLTGIVEMDCYSQDSHIQNIYVQNSVFTSNKNNIFMVYRGDHKNTSNWQISNSTFRSDSTLISVHRPRGDSFTFTDCIINADTLIVIPDQGAGATDNPNINLVNCDTWGQVTDIGSNGGYNLNGFISEWTTTSVIDVDPEFSATLTLLDRADTAWHCMYVNQTVGAAGLSGVPLGVSWSYQGGAILPSISSVRQLFNFSTQFRILRWRR